MASNYLIFDFASRRAPFDSLALLSALRIRNGCNNILVETPNTPWQFPFQFNRISNNISMPLHTCMCVSMCGKVLVPVERIICCSDHSVKWFTISIRLCLGLCCCSVDKSNQSLIYCPHRVLDSRGEHFWVNLSANRMVWKKRWKNKMMHFKPRSRISAGFTRHMCNLIEGFHQRKRCMHFF